MPSGKAKPAPRKKPSPKPAKSKVLSISTGEEDPPFIPNPLAARVEELTRSLEQVNQALIKRNGELDAAKAVAEREIFKDVVVLAAMLDAKAYLSARGGIEAALIIQRISNVEQRLGTQALSAAVVLQKVKSLSEGRRAGRELFQEEIDELLAGGEKLL